MERSTPAQLRKRRSGTGTGTPKAKGKTPRKPTGSTEEPTKVVPSEKKNAPQKEVDKKPQEKKKEPVDPSSSGKKSKCCGCSFSCCLLCHPVDLLLIFWIAGTCLSIILMDAHSVARSILGIGHDSLLTSPLFPWLEELSAIYVLWGETVDPHLIGNPIWFSAMEILNVFIVLPALVVVLLGFIRRWNWVRIPAICASVTIMHSLFVIFTSAFIGDEYPARDAEVFFFIYISGVVFSLALLWKMRQDKPFVNRPWTWKGLLGSFVIYGALLAETALVPYYLYVWNLRHRVNPVY
eukprot:TRINITY_DN82785_c0_g1_i1.p1 TRINITY_DN82785_c0_g1~~TRINITY_DN82785_c0_g1_i1.p1  ORF type:complete len:294 (+),score=68.11 TRINITY_DN82785_c0_g1_i1:145-1026(+)